jgi:NADPH:quinone reductase-like Zn-dependent oxidoreductase
MRAVVVREHGGPEVLRLEDIADPTPSPGEVVVRVRACALNHLDIWHRRGIPGASFLLPCTTGADISGDVESIGEGVSGFAPGDAVMVLPSLSCGTCERCERDEDPLCRSFGILGETCDGGLAERVVVPARNLFQKPARLSYEQAAAGSLSTLTAWHMLVTRARLRSGETVLIHGAASGVGSAAIRIAKHIGATVIATASTSEKLQAARALGADHLINYTDEDFVLGVREAVGKAGVDVVFEHVGGEVFERSLRCLGWGGRLVTCGATTGIDAKVNLRHLFFKGQSILGSTMGSRAEFAEIVRLHGEGVLDPLIDRVLPLEEIAQGHEALETRAAIGKVVMTP